VRRNDPEVVASLNEMRERIAALEDELNERESTLMEAQVRPG
jgi:uncharacterized small protein (DUF1192 family)